VDLDDGDVRARFDEWCDAVWKAYAAHHELARDWISAAFG
jgi:hypothetical protein